MYLTPLSHGEYRKRIFQNIFINVCGTSRVPRHTCEYNLFQNNRTNFHLPDLHAKCFWRKSHTRSAGLPGMAYGRVPVHFTEAPGPEVQGCSHTALLQRPGTEGVIAMEGLKDTGTICFSRDGDSYDGVPEGTPPSLYKSTICCKSPAVHTDFQLLFAIGSSESVSPQYTRQLM